VYTHDGERKPVEVNASFMEFGDREPICTISRDLTARRTAEKEKARMERQIQEIHKLESLGVLAGGIAHDFNNLLAVVLGNADRGSSRGNRKSSSPASIGKPCRQPIVLH
jgi:C4-dicarboxylate-specific signal transduction histidine kinase